MREDGPTLPTLRRYSTGTSGEGEEPRGSTTWPVDIGRNFPAYTNFVNPLILGASLGINVALLISLFSVLILDHGGLSQGNSLVGSTSPVATVSAVGPRAGIPTIVLSPTPVSGWLQVSPTAVQLGCTNGQQVQFVVVENTGTAPVQWQAIFSLPSTQVGVSVNPNQGTLNPGTSVPVEILNQTQASGPQGVTGQKGIIEFNPEMLGAGPSVTLTYSTIGC